MTYTTSSCLTVKAEQIKFATMPTITQECINLQPELVSPDIDLQAIKTSCLAIRPEVIEVQPVIMRDKISLKTSSELIPIIPIEEIERQCLQLAPEDVSVQQVVREETKCVRTIPERTELSVAGPYIETKCTTTRPQGVAVEPQIVRSKSCIETESAPV